MSLKGRTNAGRAQLRLETRGSLPQGRQLRIEHSEILKSREILNQRDGFSFGLLYGQIRLTWRMKTPQFRMKKEVDSFANLLFSLGDNREKGGCR